MKVHDNKFPYLTVAPGAAPTPPTDPTVSVLFIDSADGILKSINSAGTITTVGGASGATTLDGLTDAVVSSPALGQGIVYDGTHWVNQHLLTASSYSFASWTFGISDLNKTILAFRSTAQTGTIPLFATDPFPTGSVIPVVQKGAGQFTFDIAAGGTLHAPLGAKTARQYGKIFATCIGADEWTISGDTAV